MSVSAPRFVKCFCQFCNGHVEFDATRAGEVVACPLCGLETTLYIPNTPLTKRLPATSEPPPQSEPKKAPELQAARLARPPQLYFYKSEGGDKGAYTAGQLRSLWASGQVTADTVYRSDDSPEWMLLRDSPILSAGQSARHEESGGDSTLPKPSNLTSWHLKSAVGIKRTCNVLGIAALAAGVIGCFSPWVTFLGGWATALALPGLLLGIAGVMVAVVKRKGGLVLPLVGGLLCLLSLLIAFLANRTTSIVKEWSRDSSVTQGNITVRALGGRIAPVWWRDEAGRPQSTAPCLTLTLWISNSNTTHKVDFETWRGVGALTDDNDNRYKSIEVRPASNLLDPDPDSVSIHPQQYHFDNVVFETPIRNLKWLHLELPASNFGGNGTLRFEIPASRIKWPTPGALW